MEIGVHKGRLRTKKGKIQLYTKLKVRYYGAFQILEKIIDVDIIPISLCETVLEVC